MFSEQEPKEKRIRTTFLTKDDKIEGKLMQLGYAFIREALLLEEGIL